MQLTGGYTITQTGVYQSLHDGGSAGLGFTWFPSPELPLGFRVDGSYSSFSHTLQALAQESTNTGMNISEGYTDIYGGDVDLELDLPMGTRAKEYFFGGIGWYKERTTLKTVTYQSGTVCYFYCFPAYFPNESTASRTTSDWMKSWNAGIGFEFALSDPATFFIDARFLRIKQGSTYMDFVPIRVGLRF